ncbi:hypothetical protein RHO12_01960 [Orbus sturtevantii]|uniref:hypothetical protein n=1 Tax=Orbus sturtevantii TaxID=3074109 RepID=UPI00370D735D
MNMKWNITGCHTKSELIQALIMHVDRGEYYEQKTHLYHVCEPNEQGITVLWSVMEFNVTKDYKNLLKMGRYLYIKCYTIKNEEGQWYYSHCSEYSCPIYLTCPLEFLELAHFEQLTEWRLKVRLYHRTHSQV